jgi:tetratricopeptide (TPR) repeat protein
MGVPASAAPEEAPGGATPRPRLLALAASLRQDGRHGDAVTLYEHLLELTPGHGETMQGLVLALGAQGQTLEALHQLMAVKAGHADVASLLSMIREQSLPAIAKYNAHLQAGEIDEAEKYAAALAALIPQAEPMLNAALHCNQALGRADEAARYARALLAIDPAHPAATAALASAPAPAPLPDPPPDPMPQPSAEDLARRAQEALAPAEAHHPLVQLRDLHDAASAILCRPLNHEAVALVERLLRAARNLEIDAPEGSEWAAWERHYRVLLQGVDLRAVRGPTPGVSPEPELQFADSAGKRLRGWADLREAADRLGAKAVFFAAADESYVELYARWYALSVLKYCDVPALVVIHVIGGAGKLAKAARTVGIKDERLIFMGDDFDAGSVSIKCYDAPPKGVAERPLAHFQCARFQRVGALLQRLQRPVFVSDIDLLLQRGVEDLLERARGSDVVLNENTGNENAGSRLTANLLLLFPTGNAAVFLRFLKSYLEKALAGEEVTRWIDQLGLTMARHHLTMQGEGAEVAYFDTSTDINNVMYPSWQEHPYRFFSLFHGFDTSSLEDNPKVLGEAAPRKEGGKRRRKGGR